MSTERHSRDVDFLFEVGSLRHIERGWKQMLQTNVANDAEHTFRVQFIALLLARMEGKPFDEGLLLKMALVHDLAETRTLDHAHLHRAYIEMDEHKAVDHILRDTSLEDLKETLSLYEKREAYEAQLVKDADNLDIDLELKELESLGNSLASAWRRNPNNRPIVRTKKLYTESAKLIWDTIQNREPYQWHMEDNDWLQKNHSAK